GADRRCTIAFGIAERGEGLGQGRGRAEGLGDHGFGEQGRETKPATAQTGEHKESRRRRPRQGQMVWGRRPHRRATASLSGNRLH
ncbi:hypothetical protein C1Y35_32355, partial [Pseudomonas sp. GW456-L14]